MPPLSISRCCASHLITVTKTETKEAMCFYGKLSGKDLGVDTLRFLSLSDQRHFRQEVHCQVGECILKNGLKSVHKPSRVVYYVYGHAERERECMCVCVLESENVSTNKQLQCPKKHLSCLTYVRSKKSQDSSTAPTVPMEYDVSSL